MPFPFEIVIDGPPISVNCRTQALPNWSAEVRRVASATWPANEHPTTEPVCVSIANFFEGGGEPDADNVIKPIQDALELIVFRNDRQVVDVVGLKRDLADDLVIPRFTRLLIHALNTLDEFVHIQVSLAREPHFERL